MHGKPEVVDPYLKLGLNVQLGHQVAHELSLFELGANLCLYFVFGVDGRKINLLLLISFLVKIQYLKTILVLQQLF